MCAIGRERARILFLLTPGGSEELARASSEPAAALALPPAGSESPDPERLLELVRAHGLDLLEA